MEINDLFKRKLTWIKNESNPIIFDLKDEKVNAIIRINDFPDEIMYTVILRDEQYDMDDLPDNWTLIYVPR